MPYTNVGKGFLMKSERKSSEKSPDYSGKLEMEDGEEILVSGWVEESKSGKKYLSLSLQIHEEVAPPKVRGTRRSQPDAPADDNWSDDIPF